MAPSDGDHEADAEADADADAAPSSPSSSSLSPSSPPSGLHSRCPLTTPPRPTHINTSSSAGGCSGGGSDRAVWSHQQHQHQHQHQRLPPLIPRDYLSSSHPHPQPHPQPQQPPQPPDTPSSSSPGQALRNYQWKPTQFPTRGTLNRPLSAAISPQSVRRGSLQTQTPNTPASTSTATSATSFSGSPVSPLSTGTATVAASLDHTADRSPVSPLSSHGEPSQKQGQQPQPQQPSGWAAGTLMSQPSPPDQLRKDAASSASSRAPPPAASSSVPNPSVASAMADTAPGSRKIPRTSSIDSAISSLSSASTSQKSSLDASTVSPADITNLISAAGSPEAVIIHLLKEKQHAEAQNAQLWKLVDKQRTMVFALNKDLERATMEKEKFREKLNEPHSTPSGPTDASGESRQGTQENTAPSSKGIDKSEDGSSLAASSDKSLSRQDDSPRAAAAQAKASSAPDRANQSSSSPASSTTTQPNVSSSTIGRDVSASSRSTPSDIRRTEQLLLDQERPGSNLSNSQTRLATATPPSSQPHKSEISPTSSASSAPTPSSNPPPMPPPARRPPPAPLNLDQTERARPNVEIENREHDSESDYEDILADDEIPSFERGRRKTREDDDRHRVALMIHEEETTRSGSNKKKAKSIDPPAEVQQEQAQGGFRGMGLPASPRATLSGQQSPVPGRPGAGSPPEPISSFLSPAGSESSSTGKHQSAKSPAMSPGLPQSPRPGDRPPGAALPRKAPDRRGAMGSPPTSPRSALPAPAPAPRSPLPPAPGPPGPLAPVDSSSGGSRMSKVNGPQDQPPHTDPSTTQNIPAIDSSVQIDSPLSLPRQLPQSIYRGLMSEDHPNVLLSPDALPSIDIKVSSSRLRPSRNSYLGPKPSEEDPVFTLSVISRATGAELWRVEKVILALPQLDQQIRQSGKFPFRLPERSVFSGHSPAKVDARRAALNGYFEALLNTPMDETAALTVCQFLTVDAIEPRDDESYFLNPGSDPKPAVRLGPDGKPKMEGYLTKRGKNFGGWKSRYFVLSGPELRYYETPGGPHMGTIKLPHAQIGKQSQSSKNNNNHQNNNNTQSPSGQEDDPDNQYRHAFLVLEPKRKDSNALVRHVLCAESDAERDAWVDTLLTYVEDNTPGDFTGIQSQKQEVEPQPKTPQPNTKSRVQGNSSRKASKDVASSEPEQSDALRAFSYEDVAAAEAPVRGGAISSNKPASLAKSHSMSEDNGADLNPPMSPTLRTISGPTNGAKIQDAGAWGNKYPSSVKEKKRSIWGFRGQSSAELANVGRHDSIGSANAESRERHHDFGRPVFGLPLAEAVEFCGPRNFDCGLPAVVYRCIEYLQAKHAEAEEGIFRMSGSNVVIKSLKERFNTEGDFDIRDGNHHYDVHVVASLFKQYLRELPTTMLTKELHLDFIHVLDLKEKEAKVAAFHVLVHRLPRPNLILLKALSKFLLVIVNNAEINKMTVRNVGIVFAPTLNIPAPVFSMFLTDFDLIFSDNPPAWLMSKKVKLPSDDAAQPADDIRSPRHQMFSDLPTPAYSSFPTPRHDPSSNTSEGGVASGAEAGGYRDRRESQDTGFIPIQPTYDQQPASGAEMAKQQQQPRNRHSETVNSQSQYGSMNGMLATNSNSQQPRTKKRESSALMMGLGGRKSSMPVIRDEQAMVAEDPAFE